MAGYRSGPIRISVEAGLALELCRHPRVKVAVSTQGRLTCRLELRLQAGQVQESGDAWGGDGE